jgi:MoxR-like ATPase
MLGYNYVQLQVTPYMEEDELVGAWRPTLDPSGSGHPIVKYAYSQVHHAVSLSAEGQHTILNFDELNRLRAHGVLASVFSLLAENWIGGMYLDSGEREKLVAGKGYLHIVATQNPSSRSTKGGSHDNVDLDDALLDRFTNKAILGWPTPDEQVDVMGVHVDSMDRSYAAKVANLFDKIRTADSSEDGLPHPIAGRVAIAFMQDVTAGADPEYAFRSKVLASILDDEGTQLAVRNYARAEGVIS